MLFGVLSTGAFSTCRRLTADGVDSASGASSWGSWEGGGECAKDGVCGAS